MFPLELTASSSTPSIGSPSPAPSNASKTIADGLPAAQIQANAPHSRRRNTPEQLRALQELYRLNSRPSREERQRLADEVGMELKSVTNWFQYKRQTARRKCGAYKENAPLMHRTERTSPSRGHNSLKSTPKSVPLCHTISLDQIAELSERPIPLSSTEATRTPFSSCISNMQKGPSTPQRHAELWKHMPSSPLIPNSPPGQEEARLAALPLQPKTIRSLEWACFRARRAKWTEKNEQSSFPDTEYETATDSITSLAEDPSDPPSGLKHGTHSDDVEAAITLLEIRRRS
ncbi:hypothetical protein ID866_4549 [Astraeus odoratus]|nr:hypothetical protein ID866_4549 [Astraeus odoratus]